MDLEKSNILQVSQKGLYCPAGDFHIDPWKPVPRAVITHAHSDHARSGMGEYVCSGNCEALLRLRVGANARIKTLAFGERCAFNEVVLSLHPAGHILGSAQLRIEYGNTVAVITGDYNATHDHAAAEPYEPLACDILITESTFALPVYQWPSPDEVLAEIHSWWRANQEQGRTCVLPCYPLGKTQRILASLDPTIGPIALYGPGREFLPSYRNSGLEFPETLELKDQTIPELKGKGIVLISYSGNEPALLKRLQPLSFGAVSGWMQIRGVRRSQDLDRGFVLSDHSDWHGLIRAVKASGARKIGVTHGQTEVFSRFLREAMGLESFILPTQFEPGQSEPDG